MSSAAWTLGEIARACAGRIVPGGSGAGDGTPGPIGATLDSRSVTPGVAFFALRGERVDGHDFVPAAAAAGAGLVMVERAPVAPLAVPAVVVPDVRGALEAMARAYRALPGFPRVVGVTGSNGKTSTVRLIDSVLAAGGLRGTRPAKSFNNALGVPVTVLNARRGDDYLICEIGTSTPGEVPARTHVARPQIGVITSIGRAHVEGLGSVAGIAQEKSGIVWYAQRGATAIVPEGVPELDAALTGIERAGLGPVVRVGENARAGVRVFGVRAIASGDTEFTIDGGGFERAVFRVAMPGAHAAHNAAKAAVVGRLFGLSDEAIASGLKGVRPEPGRAVVQALPWGLGSIELLDDSYNANPESMRAGLAVLASRRPTGAGRRVAVVGDMLELGEASAAAHAEVLSAALDAVGPAGRVLAVGPRMRQAVEMAGAGAGVALLPGAGEAAAQIDSHLGPGDVVLVKASRSTRLDLVVEAIRSASARGTERAGAWVAPRGGAGAR